MRRLALATLLLLAACGKEGLLAPAAGNNPPPKPAQAAVAPTPEQMLKLPPQSQPIRVDDPATKSEERPADRFNLPPPG
jgi:hypothetical protein